jgi:hypothetical protein
VTLQSRNAWALHGVAATPTLWCAYARDHLGRVPAVAAARIRRLWGVFPLLAPIVAVSAGAALTFGQLRYRMPADPALVLLVAGLAAAPRST